MVELGTVGVEAGLHVEDAFEHALHQCDVVADTGFAAELRFQVGRSGQVVGVGVGFQNPGHGELLAFDEGNYLVGAGVAGAAGLGVVVQHRVDDGAGRARLLVHHVGHSPGGGVKNSVNQGVGGGGRHGKLLFQLDA